MNLNGVKAVSIRKHSEYYSIRVMYSNRTETFSAVEVSTDYYGKKALEEDGIDIVMGTAYRCGNHIYFEDKNNKVSFSTKDIVKEN